MNLTSTIIKSFLSVSLIPFLNSSTLLSNSNIAQAQGTNIPFDVCFNSDTFVRPSERVQVDAIREYSIKKFGSSAGNITDAEILNNDLWSSNFFVYHEHPGLSSFSRFYPYSGFWNIGENDENIASKFHECLLKITDTNSPNKVNPKTEIVLYKHKLKSIKWVNNKYIFTVEPRNSGTQVILYNKTRQDLASNNPVLIEVIDTNGRKLGLCREEFSCRM